MAGRTTRGSNDPRHRIVDDRGWVGLEREMLHAIEVAETSDFLNIAALDRIGWRESADEFIPDGEHVWRVWCEYATTLVARTTDKLAHSDDVAGALVFFPTNTGESFLHKIVVHPDCRGRGIGSALMKRAIAMATSTLLLTVDPANTVAVQLYHKFGFEILKRIDGYYRPHEDRFLMGYLPQMP